MEKSIPLLMESKYFRKATMGNAQRSSMSKKPVDLIEFLETDKLQRDEIDVVEVITFERVEGPYHSGASEAQWCG